MFSAGTKRSTSGPVSYTHLDVYKGQAFGRFVTSALIIIGYSIIAVPTGIYTAELARTMQPKRQHARCTQCGLIDHEGDAWFCRKCGHTLPCE